MDPFEEFEFKPLTEGLGFHKKKVDLSQELKKSGAITESLTKSLPPSIDSLSGKASTSQRNTYTTLNSPLPRVGERRANPTVTQSPDVIDELVRSFRKPKVEFTEAAVDLKVNKQKAVAWSLFPFMVDSMMIIAISLMCLIVSLSLTEIDFVRNLTSPATDPLFFVALAAMVGSMGVVYLTLTRGFLGSSFGEMVFDLQSGSTLQQQHPLYPIKVIGRSVLTMLTGVVLLPVLSILFRRDFAGQLTGTTLVRKD